MAKLLVFCEAPADFETVRALVERVLREQGPDWVRELLDSSPEAAREFREWMPDGEGRSYFDLHKLSTYARRHRLRAPQGHFAGRPGEAGALMGRTAFLVAREFALQDTTLEAVLLVWDMDDQGQDRRKGLAQASTEARPLVPFEIVLGCPDPMREAWVLAGFEPETEAERECLTKLRQELGFNPCEEAHRLDAMDEQAKRNPKRVLKKLTDDERDRAVRCWTEAPLARLRARGGPSGLSAFLDESAQALIPLLSGVPPKPPQD
ncbi:hypothetical protein D187_005021 [Cystobacter fuscus DSM 2262]|uniref:Uncharacterized protein n=1 Tax=Cystobacter fuscus (strain ATCC 25194 / DSM 2262 / NBRC 100088 / M29) TaxID=1242864 RepID=S9PLI4_CYSF2|nr:hypothetical protein [Cystobacter fuscus]EPX63891.1 hypothetical protein D187_005021 [Cystobacter fuscus DSM 2262]